MRKTPNACWARPRNSPFFRDAHPTSGTVFPSCPTIRWASRRSTHSSRRTRTTPERSSGRPPRRGRPKPEATLRSGAHQEVIDGLSTLETADERLHRYAGVREDGHAAENFGRRRHDHVCHRPDLTRRGVAACSRLTQAVSGERRGWKVRQVTGTARRSAAAARCETSPRFADIEGPPHMTDGESDHSFRLASINYSIRRDDHLANLRPIHLGYRATSLGKGRQLLDAGQESLQPTPRGGRSLRGDPLQRVLDANSPRAAPRRSSSRE